MTATATKPHLELDRSVLQAALSTVAPVLRRAQSLPVLQTIRWSGTSLTATDLDVFVVCRLPSDGLEGDVPEVCVPGAKLVEVCRHLTSDPVRVEWTESLLTLRSGRDRFQFRGINALEFPTPPEIEGEGVQFLAHQLAQALRNSRYAVERSEARPVLQGIHLARRNGHLAAEATDGHLLTVRPIETAAELDCILPADAVDRFLPLLEAAAEDAVATFSVKQNWAGIAVPGVWAMAMRLLDGPFPDTSRFTDDIPRDLEVVIEAEEWIAAAKRARTMTTPASGRTAITFGNGQAEMVVKDADLGDASVRVAYQHEGAHQPFTIHVNANYLLLTLQHLAGAVTMRLGRRGKTPKPIHLATPSGALSLLVPLNDVGLE